MNCPLEPSSAFRGSFQCFMETTSCDGTWSISSAELHKIMMSTLLSEHITGKMPSGLIMLDREGKIVDHNPASERIFEGTLARSSWLRDLVRESHELQGLLDRCLNSGEVFTRVEFNAPIRKDVDKRIGINLAPITDSPGE